MKKITISLVLLFIFYLLSTFLNVAISATKHNNNPPESTTTTQNPFPAIWGEHPFYLGALVGYGSTDWKQLLANCDDPGVDPFCQVSFSAPISAGDSGAVWGFYMGYEIQPHFAIEAVYTRFPNTTVIFDQYSIYANIYNITRLRSYTYAYSISGKWMVQMGSTGLRGFATAGASLSHRNDALKNVYHVNPTFGIGVNYVFIKRILFELAFQYYAGYGKATMRPAVDYIPFLYSLTGRVAYRF